MPEEYIHELMDLTEEVEGCVDHMYLDSTGNVTIGVGHLIPNVEAAVLLKLGSEADVRADFAAIKAAPKGYRADWYAKYCRCRMTQAAIVDLHVGDTKARVIMLQLHVPTFDQLPSGPRKAVFDMAFNLGMAGFLKYHHLLANIAARNWRGCAEECHRNGISIERNARTYELFLEGSK